MKKFLNDIRKSHKDKNIKKEIIISFLILLLSIGLGILSKCLDSRSFDNVILNHLDLGNFLSDLPIWLFIALVISIFSRSPIRSSINVFLFFIGMVISYHLSTIIFVGFNPTNYMKYWYALTIISPILAYICWYTRSNNKLIIILDTIIFYIMISLCFGLGMWYFDFKGILYTLTFIGTVIILYKDYKNISISFLLGLLLAFLIRLPISFN